MGALNRDPFPEGDDAEGDLVSVLAGFEGGCCSGRSNFVTPTRGSGGEVISIAGNVPGLHRRGHQA
jgi:hypothetical protein